MPGLLIEDSSQTLFVISILPCCRLFLLPPLALASRLTITLLLRGLAASLTPCSCLPDWLNKRQQEAMLLLAKRALPDVAAMSRAIEANSRNKKQEQGREWEAGK